MYVKYAVNRLCEWIRCSLPSRSDFSHPPHQRSGVVIQRIQTCNNETGDIEKVVV